MSLCAALLSKISTTDIIHALCSADFSLSEIGDILYQILAALEHYNKSQSLYIPDIMGIATEIYRYKFCDLDILFSCLMLDYEKTKGSDLKS